MTLYDCPECALPAVVTPRDSRQTTHGRLDHVFVRCVAGHWFLGPFDMLRGGTRPLATEPPQAA